MIKHPTVVSMPGSHKGHFIGPNTFAQLDTTFKSSTDEKDNSFASSTSSAFSHVKTKAPIHTVNPNQIQSSDEKLKSSPQTSAFRPVKPRKNDPSSVKGGVKDSGQVKTLLKDKTIQPEEESKKSVSARKVSPPQQRLDTGMVTRKQHSNTGRLKDKLDRSTSTTTTRTPSAGDFTFSTGSTKSEQRFTGGIPDETAGHSRHRYASSQQPPSFRRKISVRSGGSSTWAPVDEMWGPSETSTQTLETKEHVPPSYQKQKARKHKKKHTRTTRSKSPTKKEIIREVKPPPFSPHSTKHVRKTQRRSKSERSITQESPKSVSSSERPTLGRGMSARDEFRTFLEQDRISQRNLLPDDTKKRAKSQRNLVDPYARRKEKPSKNKDATKDRKRKKKPSKDRQEPTAFDRENTRTSEVEQSEDSAVRSQLLMSKQASMSTLGTTESRQSVVSPETVVPSLTSFFEWNRSPQPSEEEIQRRLRRTPSSRGVMDSRDLLRRVNSTSDINRFHLTPEWPTPKRNGRLHSMFYDLSLRRHGDRPSPGVRPVSARQMLSIMEPCSRREVMTAQGIELEPPLCREDDLLNYGEILDNISFASSKKSKASRGKQ